MKGYKNYIKVSKEDFSSILGFGDDMEINTKMVNILTDNGFEIKDSSAKELNEFMNQTDYKGNETISNQLTKLLYEAVNGM